MTAPDASTRDRRAELMIEGRIATLAGSVGFGWVEAIAIGGGRVLASGTRQAIDALVGPGTRRLSLAPDEVAVPGLTDAHLHLAAAAMSARQVDLEPEPTIAAGLARLAEADATLDDPASWLLGHGWDLDRWGRWPTADDLATVAPGRRMALWAHDHHSLWASHEALAAAEVTAESPDPPGGQIRRDASGRPSGVLHEAATRLVTARIPPPSADALVEAIPAIGRALLALGVVAVHDPGGLVPEPTTAGAYTAYARLAERGELPVRVHASHRADALDAVLAAGHRSGALLGGDADGRARVGWLKLFADGSLGSRTAALLAPFATEPDRPLEPGRERGIFVTEPATLAALTARAAAGGIVGQIHAIGDAALRAALDALEPWAGSGPLAARVEHVQLADRSDLARFARLGIAASVQPVHLAADAPTARRLLGDRAERTGYPLRSLADAGALLAFGTDAPIEPIDPWPGVAIAVTRSDPSWAPDAAPFGPAEALDLARALRAACVDPALVAGERDRGRLVAGHRADVVILPAACLDEPVVPRGSLATARPTRVLVDGRVVFES